MGGSVITTSFRYCMQMKLPDRDMRWLSKEEIENLDIKNFDANGEYGLVLEVYNP